MKLLKLSLAILTLLTLSGCMRHNRQLEGKWITVDDKTDVIVLTLKQDGTYTLTKAGEPDDQGSYYGGDTTITLHSDREGFINPTRMGANRTGAKAPPPINVLLGIEPEWQVTSNGDTAPVTWKGPDTFVLSDKLRKKDVSLDRVK